MNANARIPRGDESTRDGHVSESPQAQPRVARLMPPFT
jgi:hypothetical protein